MAQLSTDFSPYLLTFIYEMSFSNFDLAIFLFQLDSPILNDHAANAASILEGTSTSEHSQMLSQLESGDDLFNDAQTTTAASFTTTPTAAGTAISGQPTNQSAGLATAPPSKTSVSATVVPSGTPSAASVTSAVVRTAALASPSQPQNSFILSPQPVMTMASGTILTSSTTPTVIQGPGTIQYTLQPSVTSGGVIAATPTVIAGQAPKVAKPPKQQPQLLPKPATSSGANTITTISSSATSSTSTVASIVSQRPMVTMATVGSAPAPGSSPATQQFVLTNPGNVITGTNAPLLLTSQTSQPILIQQPGGNPILVMRPTAPAAPTLLPIVSSSTGTGTILLQPQAAGGPAAASVMQAAPQPQIKIITPQGRMQMQQIQTPSGPKLIAVPVGAQQAAAAAAAAAAGTVQQPQPSPTLVVNTSTNASTVNTPDLSQLSPNKKVKKKANKAKDGKGLDLGELMKDVGLDELDGYNAEAEAANNVAAVPPASNVTAPPANAIISSQGPALVTTQLTLAPSGAGNQIVAQIPQPIVQVRKYCC